MGLFEERHQRRMADPEYAAAYTEADAEISDQVSFGVIVQSPSPDQFQSSGVEFVYVDNEAAPFAVGGLPPREVVTIEHYEYA